MKIEVGEMPCTNEDCSSHEKNRPVTIFLNDVTGGLNFTCDKCGASQYAKVGQALRDSWIKRYCTEKEDLIRAAERGKVRADQSEAEHVETSTTGQAAKPSGYLRPSMRS